MHAACIKKYFGTTALPALDYTTGQLDQLALQIIHDRTSLTGVQPKLSLHLNEHEGTKRLTIVGLWGGYICKPPVYRTTPFNREIADLFPKANIDFLTFTSEPSFNRTGTLYIVADADSFIYEVTENGVKEIANAEYDEDEEAWVIRTRKLAAYAISDRELDTSVTLDGEDNTTSVDADGNKQNPDTGR